MTLHNPENVPKSCWTCLHGGTKFENYGGVCEKDKTFHPTLDPCKDYDLNAIWLTVPWCYPDEEIRKLKRMKR